MKKKSSPGLVLLRYFSGILAALILFIALANFIAGGGLFSTILLILAALFIAPIKSIITLKKKYGIKPYLTAVLYFFCSVQGSYFQMFLPQINRLQPPRPPLSLQLRQIRNLAAHADKDLNESQKEEKEQKQETEEISPTPSVSPVTSSVPSSTPSPTPSSTPTPTPAPTPEPTLSPQTLLLYANTSYYSNAWQIKTGDTISTYVQYGSSGRNIPSHLNYYSDNEEIATVDSQGYVNGVAAGTTKIHVEGERIGRLYYRCRQ